MVQVVKADKLVKVYPGKVTLYNFSLEIEEGEVLGLLGPNGAGKSTFIRIISGLEKPDSGKVMLFGSRPTKNSMKSIGVAPQENSIYPLLTCMENLLYFGSLYGVKGKKAKDKASGLLQELELSDKKNVPASFLSGGMKRRLNLACALMHEPKLIILDEPTTGLDPSKRRKMWDVVMRLVKEDHATMLLTTHYMEEAEALCEKIAFVNNGQVVTQGSPGELKKMAGAEIAKLVSIPGNYSELEEGLKKIKGIQNLTITDHGIVVEATELSSKVADITRVFSRKKEKIIEFSVSKPSLEDVFLKLTGSQLKEATKIVPKK
jgi:ABC-2 type transport system ATP-binding protein